MTTGRGYGVALTALLSTLTLIGGCAESNVYAPRISRTCDTCTRSNLQISGFDLPQRGVVMYQGAVKIFDFDTRQFSYIQTEPRLNYRIAPARVVERRDVAIADEDFAWILKTANDAWDPHPAIGIAIGCGGSDGWVAARVLLIDRNSFYTALECGAADHSGELQYLNRKADELVKRHFPAQPAQRRAN